MDIKEQLEESLKGVDGIVGVDVGGKDTWLIVYVRNALAAYDVPSEFLGVSVEKIISGDMVAGGE